MNGKKMKWQEIVSIVLLLTLWIPLVLPAMKISGDAYISAAVKVNEHAKEQDEKKAKEAGVSDMLKTYDEDTKEREEKEKEYDKEIEKKKGSILGFELVKWGLTAKEHDDLKLTGITLQKEKTKAEDKGSEDKDSGDSKDSQDSEDKGSRDSEDEDGGDSQDSKDKDSGDGEDSQDSEDEDGEDKDSGDSQGSKDKDNRDGGEDGQDHEDRKDGEDSTESESGRNHDSDEDKEDSQGSKEKKIEDSGVAGVFKLMGIFMLLPAVLGIAGCVAVFIKRKGYGIWLIVSGLASAGAYLAIQYILPGMIWDKTADYIEEFSLINKEVLDMEDMGTYAVSTMMHAFSSVGMWAGLILGCVLAVAGILFMTAFKLPEQQAEDDWDFDLPPVGSGMPPVNDGYAAGGNGNMYAAGQNGGGYPANGNGDMYAPDDNRNGYPMGNGGEMYAPGGNDGMYQESFGSDGNFGYQNGGWGNQEAASGMDQMVTEAWQDDYAAGSPAAQMGNLPKGMLLGVAGQYRGAVVEMNAGEEVILGRDPKYCKLVFDYAKVSRKHCGIIYDAASGMYRVIDYSSNGTILSNGQEALAGSYITVPPGTVVYLADKHEGVELCSPAQNRG